MNIDCRTLSLNPESDSRDDLELTRLESDIWRCPNCKTLRVDAEPIGNSCCHILKLEHPILGCHDRTRVTAFNFLKDDRRVREDIAVGIGDGAHDSCGVRPSLSVLA